MASRRNVDEDEVQDHEEMGLIEASQVGDMERVFLIVVDAFQPAFSVLFVLLFVVCSFLQENHPYSFAFLVVVYLFTQGFSGKKHVHWYEWSIPYKATGKALLIICIYILVGFMWAVVRSVINIIRLDRLAAPQVVEFYGECHRTAATKLLEIGGKGPVLCTQADYIHMMALQKVGFLKSMLIWPFDLMRMACTELFMLAYDIGYSIYQKHGGKMLMWADGIRQKYVTEEL